MNPNPSFADANNLAVTYRGESPQKQLQFSSGPTPLVNHVFSTPQEAVARFGRRLVTEVKEFTHSTPYKDGGLDATNGKPYNPNRAFGHQAVLEYGTGYLRGLVQKLPASAPREQVMTEAEHYAAMRKADGRDRK